MSEHLPVLRSREVVRAFERAGFAVLPGRGKGSHVVMARQNHPSILTVPNHDPVKRGTLRKIIRDAGMSVEEFRNLL
jgi:predicted RNA binding protein YcfA (HicA-like mRNA interferase family)